MPAGGGKNLLLFFCGMLSACTWHEYLQRNSLCMQKGTYNVHPSNLFWRWASQRAGFAVASVVVQLSDLESLPVARRLHLGGEQAGRREVAAAKVPGPSSANCAKSADIIARMLLTKHVQTTHAGARVLLKLAPAHRPVHRSCQERARKPPPHSTQHGCFADACVRHSIVHGFCVHHVLQVRVYAAHSLIVETFN